MHEKNEQSVFRIVAHGIQAGSTVTAALGIQAHREGVDGYRNVVHTVVACTYASKRHRAARRHFLLQTIDKKCASMDTAVIKVERWDGKSDGIT